MSFQVQKGTIRCVDTIRCEFQHRIRSASGQSGASFRGKSGVLQGIQSAVSFKVKLGVSGQRIWFVSGQIRVCFRQNQVCYERASGVLQGKSMCVLWQSCALSGIIRCAFHSGQNQVRFRTESGAFQGRIRCFKISGHNQVCFRSRHRTRCLNMAEPGVSIWQNQMFHSSESGVSGQRTKYFMAESGMFQGKNQVRSLFRAE